MYLPDVVLALEPNLTLPMSSILFLTKSLHWPCPTIEGFLAVKKSRCRDCDYVQMLYLPFSSVDIYIAPSYLYLAYITWVLGVFQMHYQPFFSSAWCSSRMCAVFSNASSSVSTPRARWTSFTSCLALFYTPLSLLQSWLKRLHPHMVNILGLPQTAFVFQWIMALYKYMLIHQTLFKLLFIITLVLT